MNDHHTHALAYSFASGFDPLVEIAYGALVVFADGRWRFCVHAVDVLLGRDALSRVAVASKEG